MRIQTFRFPDRFFTGMKNFSPYAGYNTLFFEKFKSKIAKKNMFYAFAGGRISFFSEKSIVFSLRNAPLCDTVSPEERFNSVWRKFQMSEESLPETMFPFKKHYFEQRGVKVHYTDEGSGPVILLFHACPMWSFSFRHLIAELSTDHRVIAFDLPGFGLSTKNPDGDYTLDGYINLTENFIDFLGLQNMTFILHGWGGTVGMGYAVRHPKKINALIIMNSMAFSDYALPWRLKLCRFPGLGKWITIHFGLKLFRNDAVHPRKLAEIYNAPYQNYEDRIALYHFAIDIPTVPEADSAQKILEIETGLWMFRSSPALILWAAKDWLYPPRLLKRWRRYLPKAETELIPKAGRFMMEEQTEVIRDKVRSFLAKHQL